MELRYQIPQGAMIIRADVFFLEARRCQIRKMLRDYKRSDPEGEEIGALRAWMTEKIESGEKNLEHIDSKIGEQTAKLREHEWSCEFRKKFFESREQLEEAKEALKASRAEARRLASDLRKAKRDLEAYKKSLEDVERILGSEEEMK